MLRFDRRLVHHFDWVMLLMLVLVSGMALANLYSSTWSGSGTASAVFYKQLYLFVAALVLILLFVVVDYGELATFGYLMYGGVVLLLVYTNFFVATIADTQRWINLGFFRLQPSEPAKFILVLVLASSYAKIESRDGLRLRDLLRPGILTAIPFVLILIQPDLGTALMLGILFVSMTLFVKLRWSTIAILGGMGMGAALIGWKYLLKDYQRRRIETFLNPEGDPMNHGYQIMQSKIAVGSGETFGKGFMEGTQGHLNFLPERHTDFAFSVWAEEWGFAGCLIFLGCYFFLLIWGLNIALGARDKFGVLLAYGLVMMIFWQAVINLFMIMGFLPVVGIPLPLFSYGGSSLITTMVAIGVMMNIRMRRFQVS
ncbi:rod shape-determining protein RodA [Desulfogranum mediterraneum]|uniref:rod shape-determining protein RodA n=1 Tax=Desulfogranum mediterraneum TaxID=160661 RepID=UPI00048C1FCB|nr:rod shape-determining protein RodA [Desulfogranum mediterraneum]